MNTSNKILTGFFILVFLVPVLIVMAFKSKIRNNDFKMVSRDWHRGDNWRTGRLSHVKVVKLLGTPGNALKVKLSFADTASYSYHKSDRDSVHIQVVGDALLVHYNFENIDAEDRAYTRMNFNLSLAGFDSLIADNVEVRLASWDSTGSSNMSVDLKGTSRFIAGIPSEEEGYVWAQEQKPVRLNRFTARVADASLSLGSMVRINEMSVNTTGNATIGIGSNVSVGSISGTLSDSTSVHAGWQFLKHLNVLTAQ